MTLMLGSLLLASVRTDAVPLVLLTLLGAAPVVLLGAWLTRRRSGAPLSRQILVVALAPLMATWVGALVAARLMFISPRDLASLGLIAVVAALVGVVAAGQLTRRVRRDTAALETLSQWLSAGRAAGAGGDNTGDATADTDRDTDRDTAASELGRLGTQLRAMSNELVAAHDRELRLANSRRELVAWVSQDLRAPLAEIRQLSEPSSAGTGSRDQEAQRLAAISGQCDRLALLVDDLFELSRLSSGALELAPRPLPAADLVGGAVAAVRERATERGIELVCESESSPPLMAAPVEAAKVLRHLLEDSVRRTADGGRVRLTVTAELHDAVITIIDGTRSTTAPAVDAERVFEAAFRSARSEDLAAASTTAEVLGVATPARSGLLADGADGPGSLGLEIAHRLAEAQCGSIGTIDGPDGRRVTVRFPRYLGAP